MPGQPTSVPSASSPAIATNLGRADFASGEAPRWCPGCGSFSIISQLQKVLAELGQSPEEIAVVSGIGCSSRLPYYMSTYGFHGIHGRALPIATGLKGSRPDLPVWVVTGDGDALSIGGNHLLHALRRNVDVKILLFNNRIYGLTKGQVSPTSERGKVTKSSPYGSIDEPVNPTAIALAAEASFVARSIDGDSVHLQEVFRRAALHRGSAFVELLVNCVIYNDGAWREIADPAFRDDRIVKLEHGKPALFGRNRDRGLRRRDGGLEAVQLGAGVSAENLLVHDEFAENPAGAFHLTRLLTRLAPPDSPVPIGVFREVSRPTHDELLGQISNGSGRTAEQAAQAILDGADAWRIEDSMPASPAPPSPRGQAAG